eukprot:gnl/TRDRNA2_/TRDRNA2_111009_c0_seq1.p1 gnl/TRDRNA2_/TRDRNA2_111009_c0~~gnl/TRDRNA2_/TRDRNA2_111009_c0_seq1.p1  ORF type:complete len:347 (+),score=45.20 gnl/TRDRNA2_/TRDRNA2_111009_c0_seq1:3-1043(+)
MATYNVVQALVRHQLLFDAAASSHSDPWAARLAILESGSLCSLQRNASFPDDIRVSFPPLLYTRMLRRFGREAPTVCEVSNEAPTSFLRVNPLAGICRSQVLEVLNTRGFDARASTATEWCIHIASGPTPVARLPEYFDGMFEIQDESSQIVAALVRCQPQDVVVDLCCGAGGKALAVLAHLSGRGRLVAHEPRRAALRRAEHRLQRARALRADVAQVVFTDSLEDLPVHGSVDWVLVDAPCSNTGSLRRHPECKYRIFRDQGGRSELASLLRLQRRLLRQASDLLRDGGSIVYSTCSLLHAENEAQIRWAQRTLGLRSLELPFTGCFAPVSGGRDGFFAAVLHKK